MLIIIVGIIAAIGCLAIGAWVNSAEGIFNCLALLVFLVAIFTGICAPVTGYTDWELVSEEELISLSNDTGTSGNLFAIRTNGIYSYRVQIKSEFGTNSSKEYELRTIDAKYVVEVEDPEIEKPVLKIYKRVGKTSVFSFALWTEQKKYVFYVPKGTIKENINLD